MYAVVVVKHSFNFKFVGGVGRRKVGLTSSLWFAIEKSSVRCATDEYVTSKKIRCPLNVHAETIKHDVLWWKRK